ncbi:hypothetical protein J7J13_02635 [bacterium]|nr:hypothetical protein [bacterium]
MSAAGVLGFGENARAADSYSSNKCDEFGLESDVNGDGVVNTRDLGIMMSNWQN